MATTLEELPHSAASVEACVFSGSSVDSPADPALHMLEVLTLTSECVSVLTYLCSVFVLKWISVLKNTSCSTVKFISKAVSGNSEHLT